MSWPLVKLGDVCQFVRGPFGGSLKKAFFVDNGYAVYEQQHAIYNQFEEVRYFIDEKKFNELKRFELQPGDLIMSCSGTMGKIAIAPDGIKRGVINQALLKLRPLPEVDIYFLKYWLSSVSFQFKLNTHTHGAAIKNVASVAVLKELEIPLPSLKDQKRIVTILDKADIIRCKRLQSIQLGEEFLRAMFLEMFGDPVTNPKDFPLGTIRDLVESAKYGTSAKASDSQCEFPILRMGNITYEGAIDMTDLKYIDLKEKDKPKYLISKGDLLFNRTNSKELVGKTAVYDKDEPVAIAGYLVRVRTNSKGNNFYISGYLNSKHGKVTLQNMCKSIVGMANINAQEMQNIPILIPPIELQNNFERIVMATKAKLKVHQSSLKYCTDLCNSLSQKAFAGQV